MSIFFRSFAAAISASFLPLLSFAQSDAELCKAREVVVKTSVTGPLQDAPYATLGVEVPVSCQVALQGDVGYIYGYAADSTRLNRALPSYSVRLSAKYYIPKSTTLRVYTGPSISYRKLYTRTGRVDWWDEPNPQGDMQNTPHLMMDNAIAGATGNVDILWLGGIQPLILRHFALDLFIGAGVGFEKVKMTPRNEMPAIHRRTYFSKIIGLQAGYAF